MRKSFIGALVGLAFATIGCVADGSGPPRESVVVQSLTGTLDAGADDGADAANYVCACNRWCYCASTSVSGWEGSAIGVSTFSSYAAGNRWCQTEVATENAQWEQKNCQDWCRSTDVSWGLAACCTDRAGDHVGCHE